MVECSREESVWAAHPEGEKVVEFVFHLGKPDMQGHNFSKQDEQGYPGVDYKFFDNRSVEAKALEKIDQDADFKETVLRNLVSWSECPEITFLEA